MIAHVAECGVSGPQRLRLSQKLRPNLLALKQLEQCYMLAHWIRGLFMDIIERPERSRTEQKPGLPKEAQHLDSSTVEGQSTTPDGHPPNHSGITPGSNYLSGNSTTPTDHSFSVGEAPLPRHFPGGEGPSYLDLSISQSPMETSLGSLFPNFITTDFFTPPYGVPEMTMGDFPSPSSLEYQSLHFLADLGLSGYTEDGSN